MRIIEAGRDEVDTVRHLFEAYAASLPFSLDFQNFGDELSGLPAPYGPPGGCLLLACGAIPLGTVGLKPLAPRTGEIKRLYVVPEGRGLGTGKALLERVIEEARRLGYSLLRLDSHRASMAAAIALYRRFGFVEIPPYGPDLGGELAFFEKDLG